MDLPPGVQGGAYRASIADLPRTLASSGYWLVRVGKDHPMADVRGCVYEHRLVVSETIGRPLASREYVHHRNHDPLDNRPENLEIVTPHEHLFHHRKPGSRRREFGEPNPTIECACGCGMRFARYDRHNRPRTYAPHHFVPLGQQPVSIQEGARRGDVYDAARNDAEGAVLAHMSYEGFRRWRRAAGLPRKVFVRARSPICPRCGMLRLSRHRKTCARRK